MNLEKAIENIKPLDTASMKLAKERLDSLTKPLGSLGKLEELVISLSGIQRTDNPDVSKRAVVVMCADNGVVEEGVSSCPKEVTATVTRNFMKGFTGINVFVNFVKADLVVCDIGVDDDLSEIDGIIHRKIRRGTDNIMKGPAMSRKEAIRAIEIGIETVGKLYKDGYRLIGTGEMGIGNTTTSSAVTAVLTQNAAEIMTGKGAGLTQEAYIQKTEVVRKAIEINYPYEDAIDILAKLGGFDIAGICGCFIGAAAYGIPCVIDGFISAAAALVAVNICPDAKNYMFASHFSNEKGTASVMSALGMEAMLNLDMRLGEGTGAALSFLIFDTALEAFYCMGTFDDASIEQYSPQV